jgi:hypothetical protein
MIGKRSSIKTFFGLTEVMFINNDECLTRQEVEKVMKGFDGDYYISGTEIPVVEFPGKTWEEVEKIVETLGF